MKNLIAIVGRPNVGKSSLFNKIIEKPVAITLDKPGVTRDRIYENAKWGKKSFQVIDTGGIEIKEQSLQSQIKLQAQIAINEADIIVFVVDGRQGITHDDELIARILRQAHHKHVVIAANKLENITQFDDELWNLGFDIYKISALHGTGVGDLLDDVTSYLTKTDVEDDNNLKLTILGRPNSGKSSLLNALTKTNRSIVSPIANTTRDSIKDYITINDQKYQIIDTAGINKKSKLTESVDHYALMRAKRSLEEANIVLLVIDITKELAHFDARIIGYAFELNKPIILVANKWDLISKEIDTISNLTKKLRHEFKFVDWAPIVFISALKKINLNKLENTITLVTSNLQKYIKTSLVNNLLLDMQSIKPASAYRGGRLHISFGKQIHAKIPTFILHINNKRFLHFSFARAVENQFRKSFGFEGTPIKIIFQEEKK